MGAGEGPGQMWNSDEPVCLSTRGEDLCVLVRWLKSGLLICLWRHRCADRG